MATERQRLLVGQRRCAMAAWMHVTGVPVHTQVIDCADWGVSEMSQDDFFSLYGNMGCAGADEPPVMLKLKDWPARAHFRKRLPHHNQARSAPVPACTRRSRRANMARASLSVLSIGGSRISVVWRMAPERRR